MAEEQKSRLGNIIGLITAVTGLIAALLAVTNALKPSLFGGGNSATPTQAAANTTVVASGNTATPAPAARAATVTRATGTTSRAASGGGATSESSDAGATETAKHHDSTADTQVEETHTGQDPEE